MFWAAVWAAVWEAVWEAAEGKEGTLAALGVFSGERVGEAVGDC